MGGEAAMAKRTNRGAGGPGCEPTVTNEDASFREVAWISLLIALAIGVYNLIDSLETSAEYAIKHFGHYLSLSIGGIVAAGMAFTLFLYLARSGGWASKFGFGCSGLLLLLMLGGLINLLALR
jgi:hypothetical protein